MEIKKNSWHYKVYAWFKGGDVANTSLCPYARTVFIWAPLKFILGTGKIGPIHMAAVSWPLIAAAIPFILWRTHQYSAAKGILFAYSMCAFIGLIVYVGTTLEERDERRLKAQMNEDEWNHYEETKVLPERIRQRKLFYMLIAWFNETLLGEFLTAIHNKVCPLIRFDDSGKVHGD